MVYRLRIYFASYVLSWKKCKSIFSTVFIVALLCRQYTYVTRKNIYEKNDQWGHTQETQLLYLPILSHKRESRVKCVFFFLDHSILSLTLQLKKSFGSKFLFNGVLRWFASFHCAHSPSAPNYILQIRRKCIFHFCVSGKYFSELGDTGRFIPHIGKFVPLHMGFIFA